MNTPQTQVRKHKVRLSNGGSDSPRGTSREGHMRSLACAIEALHQLDLYATSGADGERHVQAAYVKLEQIKIQAEYWSQTQ